MFVGGALWQLVIDYTDGKKSLSMAMITTVLKYIHLYLCPLLSLAAEVVFNF